MSIHLRRFVAIIIEDTNKLTVLQLRDDKPGIGHPGHWSFWGGKQEPGETPLAGAVREVNEELSLHSLPEEYEFVGDFFEQSDKLWHVFRYRPGADLDGAVVTEGQGLGRFKAEEISEGTIAGRPVHPVLLIVMRACMENHHETRE